MRQLTPFEQVESSVLTELFTEQVSPDELAYAEIMCRVVRTMGDKLIYLTFAKVERIALYCYDKQQDGWFLPEPEPEFAVIDWSKEGF